MRTDIRVGSAIPGFEVQPSEVQLFLFSAATWNPHRIHFDEPYATEVEGHQGVIVHGPLLGAWMLRLIEDWSRGWGMVVDFEYRNILTASVSDRLSIQGQVTGSEDDITVATQIFAQGRATVCEGVGTIRRR